MKVSKKAAQFTESVIREMTRLATKHGAVNLAQGFPDFPCPQELKDAASKAIEEDYNQYSVTWGAPMLREACERATLRTIPDIVFLLQQLAHEKERKT